MQNARRSTCNQALCAFALAAAGALAACSAPATRAGIEFCLLAGLLAAASAFDIAERRIPNACIVAALGLRAASLGWVFAASGNTAELAASAAGVAVVGGFAAASALAGRALTGREALGAGDVKLLAVSGAYLGPYAGMAAFAASCLLGAASTLLGKGEDATFPFAPAISFCTLAFIALW